MTAAIKNVDKPRTYITTKKNSHELTHEQKRSVEAIENAMRIIQELKEAGFVIEPTPLNR